MSQSKCFMSFELKKEDGQARRGEITFPRGKIQTPAFMPVGTYGTVKGMLPRDIEEIGADIILGNTFHLMLRPGTEVVEKHGTLHDFIQWDKPILTDSGGFQVFSLGDMRKITEEGVVFKSPIDGSPVELTPEISMDVQRKLGSDIVMIFDECTPYPCDYRYAKNSMHMTHRWLKRCCDRFDTTDPLYDYSQTLFPIVQGSTYKDLRKQSAEKIASFEREGNAIGGLSVGEPDDEMYEMCEVVTNILPEDKPRYLMGVGTPLNLLENIALGIDMFDCVMPTRNARNGMLFTSKGIINIKNKKWADDFSPIDPDGTSYVDTFYTKAYLRHLIHSKERLGGQIATLHNLAFYMWLVNEAREQIIAGTFYDWKKQMVKQLGERL